MDDLARAEHPSLGTASKTWLADAVALAGAPLTMKAISRPCAGTVSIWLLPLGTEPECYTTVRATQSLTRWPIQCEASDRTTANRPLANASAWPARAVRRRQLA